MLFEVAPADPIVFCALATLLAGVAVLACLTPAPCATRVDPHLVKDDEMTAIQARMPPGTAETLQVHAKSRPFF